ncbi:3-beta hydroxysteroid dehydrogenase/isomerase family-domain-containing protein [Schizophyllum fasciatum]
MARDILSLANWQLLVYAAIALAVPFTYIKLNDSRLKTIPQRVLRLSPKRVTHEDVSRLEKELTAKGIAIEDQLPPRTGRRYIVVGGAGFLGGWLVLHLIRRGEDPKNIRVIDLRRPTRSDLQTDEVKDVAFLQLDITDKHAVDRAFDMPWPNGADSGLTVFNTAANILFYERDEFLLQRSTRINVNGMQNVLDASRRVGASIFIQTSSGSVAVRSSRYLLWLWEREPKHFVQVINDEDSLIPKRHEDHFSNYAASKYICERRVLSADKSPSGRGVLRTGALRPGNGIFGPGGDAICGYYLQQRTNPTWILRTLQSFIYVENCSLAHLLYEARLLARERGDGACPDIGGQAFAVTDPGPPATYGDIATALTALTGGQCTFPSLSPTLMLAIAYIVEAFYVTRHRLLASGRPWLARLLPEIKGEIASLQPSLWNLVGPHLIFDDSRARLPPEQGGLGYRGVWTTMEGVLRTYQAFANGSDSAQVRSWDAAPAVSVIDQVKSTTNIDLLPVLEE